MAIYDCFPFFGGGAELDLLDLRLHELDGVVDKFVLVEATMTHSGFPKRLHYAENVGRFEEFDSRIQYIIVDDMPTTYDEIQAAITPQDRVWLATGYQLGANWVRERYQRNHIMEGLIDCNPDDIIVIEDADEIVKRSVLENIKETIVDGSNAATQTLNTYYMNWQCTNMFWAGSKILKYEFVDNPSEHRFHTPAAAIIPDAGWHFGFLGGASAIKRKLQSYAHQEFNNAETFNNIGNLLANQKDALGRLYEYKTIPIETLPKYVISHPEIYGKYMYVP